MNTPIYLFSKVYALTAKAPTAATSSYFYHSDHLGSSSIITDQAGSIIQHMEYVPFGETFIDERRSTGSWTTPYLFSSKERDQETGLLYFGARYQDSKYGIWYSVDPLAEKYPNVSSYVYCKNNPVRFIDPDGREIYGFEVSFKGTVGFFGVSLGKALGLKYSAGAAENELSFHMKYDSNSSNLTVGGKHVIREHKKGGYQVSGAYGKAKSEQRETGTEGSVSVNLKSGKIKTTDGNVNDRSFKAVEEGSVGILTTTEKEGEPSKSSVGLAPEFNFGLGAGAAVNLSVQESDQKNTGKTTQNTTHKSTTQHKKNK